jgi:hypothetical protein
LRRTGLSSFIHGEPQAAAAPTDASDWDDWDTPTKPDKPKKQREVTLPTRADFEAAGLIDENGNFDHEKYRLRNSLDKRSME